MTKPYIPLAILIVLAAATTYLITQTNREPVIESITPDVAVPGEELTIRGDRLGNGGRIEVDALAVPAGNVSSWSQNAVTFIVPNRFRSGQLVVETSSGVSNAIFVIAAEDMPTRVGDDPTVPVVDAVEPDVTGTELHFGETVVVRGRNFGSPIGGARVMAHVEDAGRNVKSVGANGRGAPEPIVPGDRELLVWRDTEVEFLPPPELFSNTRTVSVVFEVETAVGGRFELAVQLAPLRGERVESPGARIAIQRELAVMLSGGGGVAWMRVPAHGWTQPDSQVLRQNVAPAYRSASIVGYDLSRTEGDVAGRPFERLIRRSELVTVRAVTFVPDGTVDAGLLTPAFTRVYAPYLTGTRDVPADFKLTVARLVSGDPDLFARAEAVFDRVITLFEPDPGGIDDAQAALAVAVGGDTSDNEGFGARAYADALVAGLRASGIPARTLSGILVLDDGTMVNHFWAEFLLPEAGWIPVDPAWADGLFASERATAAEGTGAPGFASLDGRRVLLGVSDAVRPRRYPLSTLVEPDGTGGVVERYVEYAPHSFGGSVRFGDPILLSVSD